MGVQESGRTSRFGWWLPVVLAAVLLSAFAVQRFLLPSPLQEYSAARDLMDTRVEMTVYASDLRVARQAVEDAFARMSSIEVIASSFSEGAAVYQLNEERRLDDPAGELVDMLQTAHTAYTETEGAFDITVEPLLELWRFDPEAEIQFWDLPPDEREEAIQRVMAATGPQRIHVTKDRITLDRETKITLGGIAKGYAVDAALQQLRQAKIPHALINAGGDIAAYGGKPGGQSWTVDLDNPNEGDDRYLTRFALLDGAIATSGNYERYFDDEAQVGHIMDPRTGYSSHASSSATVIAPTATQADVWATAIFVLGPQRGTALINSTNELESLVVAYDDPTQVHRSDGLPSFER